ncbi:MAG: hypothetical protein ACXV4C_05820 [Halobacteriota archaeon]
MGTWNLPPITKVYEALSAVADGRVKLTRETSAHVVSSGGDKTYTVKWSPDGREITSDDNATRWQGYLGYPIIAVLLLIGRLPYDPTVARWLAGVPWHDLNEQYKRNYDAAVDYVLERLQQGGGDAGAVRAEAVRILEALARLGLKRPSRSSYSLV